MTRLLAAALVGLLALGAASADVVSRSAALVIQDMSLDALGTTDQAPEPSPAPTVVESDGTSPEPVAPTEAPPEITTVQNVLLVGVDSRAGLTREQMREMDAFDHDGQLTDTVIWVQYLPDTRDIRMVAFPRDIAVVLADGRREKLNAIHPIDGPNALVAQIEEMVGEDLDHYVEVDLAGFVTMTDAVGGVEVCLEEPLVDEVVGTIDEGRQVLDGIDAGRFVRSRKSSDSFGSGTFGRAARQQYFLSQALKKVLSAGTLTDPGKLRSLVNVASTSVVVDDELSLSDMYELASVFRSIEPQGIESAIVPVVAFSDGLYYERIDDSAEALFSALRTGEPLPIDSRTDRDPETDDDVVGGLDGFSAGDGVTPSPPTSSAGTPSATTTPEPAASSPVSSSELNPAVSIDGVIPDTPSPSPTPDSLCG